MKTTHLILILVLTAIIIGTLVWCANKPTALETNKQEKSTETKYTGPLTLDYLKSRPDWNPTQQVEGMYRVEDGVATLGGGVESKTRRLTEFDKQLNKVDTGFTITHADSSTDKSSYNKKDCVHYKNEHTQIRDCVATPIHKINEFIITSDDTGEVLHKFKLEEGYSLAFGRSTANDIPVVRAREVRDNILRIDVHYWQDWSNVNYLTRHAYDLNLMTGEVVEKYKTGVGHN